MERRCSSGPKVHATQCLKCQPHSKTVKTLPTIMKELGHKRVHVLKIDVEGSEWLFLEDMFDRMGCPPVDQITVEFHHFDFDSRYGMIPQVMAVTNLLRACGWKTFERLHHWSGKDSGSQQIMTYGLASYCRRCGEAEDWVGPRTSWSQ